MQCYIPMKIGGGKDLTLWVWERAMVPRGSSFSKAKLQRRRATTSYPTKNKEKSWSASSAAQIQKNISLNTTDPCILIIAWKCNNTYCAWSCQFVHSNPIGQYFLFICLSFAVWLCHKHCSENRVLVVLLKIWVKDFTVLSLWVALLQVFPSAISLGWEKFQTLWLSL